MNTPAFAQVNARMRYARAASQGFALLEAMVALLLFSIGILGLLGLQARAVSTAGDTEDRNRAALIADRCASQMQLQASKVTVSGTGPNTARFVANICNTWSIDDQTRDGLSNGHITATPTTAFAVVPGNALLAPVTVDIQVTWCSHARAVTQASSCDTPSKLTTQATLLVQNH